MSAFPYRLRWDEINPTTQPFAEARLPGIVERALAPYDLPGEWGSAGRVLAERRVTRGARGGVQSVGDVLDLDRE